jgi:peptidoglycan/LPS O-acetylase OafA/YrhL
MAIEGSDRAGEVKPLTGLRGVAALLVVFNHYFTWAAATPVEKIPLGLFRYGATGGIGMAIFFTLSGFVIALSYSAWNWGERPLFNLTRFFFYRFARLYPAFFLFAVLIILRTPALQNLADPHNLRIAAVHLLLWHAWLPIKYDGQVATDDMFNVSWSLSTEVGLYLLFALAMIAAARLPRFRYKGVALWALAALLIWTVVRSLWLARHHIVPPSWSDDDYDEWLFYTSPYAVIAEFAIGALAWRLSKLPALGRPLVANAASVAGALGLCAIYLLNAHQVISLGLYSYRIVASLAVAGLLFGASGDNPVNRFLGSRPLLWVGTISYSLYLFHFAVPAIALHGKFAEFAGPAIAYYAANYLVSLGLALALAAGIYQLVEVPGRRWIRRFADRLLGLAPGAALAQPARSPAE